jgi:hypothetical protein
MAAAAIGAVMSVVLVVFKMTADTFCFESIAERVI